MLVPAARTRRSHTARSFKEEVQTHAANAAGCVVLRDLSIHHRKWLNHSNRNSLEGQDLCSVCEEIGLTQLISEPTGFLVLSSVTGVQTRCATLKLSVPSQVEAGRKVWRYRQADWERLSDLLADTCWDHIV